MLSRADAVSRYHLQPRYNNGSAGPLARVLELDAHTSGIGAWLGFGSGGVMLMAALVAGGGALAWAHTRDAQPDAAAVQEIEIAPEEPPPPPQAPPEDTPEVEQKQAAPAPAARPAAATVAKETPSPAPPARAGQVLTAEPRPDEPVDLTGNAMVQGAYDSYAGSATAPGGTGDAPGTRPVGPRAGTGPLLGVPAPAPRPVDCSRVASLSGGTDWSCPFPAEADSAEIDDAVVVLQVDVGADGAATAVQVRSDPGHGFGREARRCALSKRYATALDRDGIPVPGATRPFQVRFSR